MTRNTNEACLISIVIPTYNSVEHLETLFKALGSAANKSDSAWELIVVDDGSDDGTWGEIERLKANFATPVRAVKLLQNAGQHAALLAGFRHSTGQFVVTMDDDLQHDPADIDALIAPLICGADLVIASYDHKQHAKMRNLGGALIDRLLGLIFELPSDLQLTSFRAMRNVVAQQALNTATSYPYITALLLSNARTVQNVAVCHAPQQFRKTTYTFTRSVRLGFNLIFGHSRLPVLAMVGTSLIAFVSALMALAWVVIAGLNGAANVPGWASTIAVVTVFQTLTLASLAVIGVYVARIHTQLVGRKALFVVDEVNE